MSRIEILLMTGLFLITICISSAFAETIQTPKVPQVKKPAAVQPYKATPVEKPQATSDRDSLSAAGYGEDNGEETQERPNPLDADAAQALDPMRDPVRGPKNTPSR